MAAEPKGSPEDDLRETARRIQRSLRIGNEDSPPYMFGMSDSERLGRLEGITEGVKHGQTQVLVAIGILAAFVIGFSVYGLQKMATLHLAAPVASPMVWGDL